MSGTSYLKNAPNAPEAKAVEPEGRASRLALSNWLRLARTYGLMLNKLRRTMEQECGLTLPQFDVLAQLYRDGKALTFVELSRKLLVTSGNLTGIVDRLAAAGLVVRQPDSKDRRVVRVELTASGSQLIEEMAPRHASDVAEMMNSLTEPEQLELRRVLGILRDSLQR
jgi:DNA-binding MarR family transcriptional regulator